MTYGYQTIEIPQAGAYVDMDDKHYQIVAVLVVSDIDGIRINVDLQSVDDNGDDLDIPLETYNTDFIDFSVV